MATEARSSAGRPMARSTRAESSTAPPARPTRSASCVRGNQAGSRRRPPTEQAVGLALDLRPQAVPLGPWHTLDPRDQLPLTIVDGQRGQAVRHGVADRADGHQLSEQHIDDGATGHGHGRYALPEPVSRRWASPDRTRVSRSLVTTSGRIGHRRMIAVVGTGAVTTSGTRARRPCSRPSRSLTESSGSALGRGLPVIRSRSSRPAPASGSHSSGPPGPAGPMPERRSAGGPVPDRPRTPGADVRARPPATRLPPGPRARPASPTVRVLASRDQLHPVLVHHQHGASVPGGCHRQGRGIGRRARGGRANTGHRQRRGGIR